MPTIAEVRQQYPQYSDMSDADLAGALHKKFYSDMPAEEFNQKIGLKAEAKAPDDHGLARRQGMTAAERLVSPITEYPRNYAEMNQEARDQMSRGVGQIAHPDSLIDPKAHGISDVLTGAANVALGGLGYVASPISAAYRSVIGQPVEDVTGIPREYTEFGAQLATPGIGFGRLPAKPGAPVNPANYQPRSVAPGEAAPLPGTGPSGAEAGLAMQRLREAGFEADVPRSVTSDNIQTQRAGEWASNVPLVGDPLKRAVHETVPRQLIDARDKIAADLGSGTGANVANRAGNVISEAAAAETRAATDAARQADEAALAAHERAQAETLRGIGQAETQSLDRARAAVGNMSPQDMGQALITRLRTGEQEAQSVKNHLYSQARESDAVINADAVRNIRNHVNDAVTRGNVEVYEGTSPRAAEMLNTLDRFAEFQSPENLAAPRPMPPAPRPGAGPQPGPTPAAPQASAAAAPQGQSLTEFLASKGGLGPDAELGAIGADRHVVDVGGVGKRRLVKQGGSTLDYAREAAEEAGYLPKGATPNDLLDALDAEMRGNKLYPQGLEGTQTSREAAAAAERSRAEHSAFRRGLEKDLADAGHGELGSQVKARTLKIMEEERIGPDDAVEKAIRQLDHEDARKSPSSDFPGDRPAPTSGPAGPGPSGVSIHRVDEMRKYLRGIAQKAETPTDQRAAGAIMRAFDGWETNAFDNALVSGSPEGLDVVRRARAANRDLMERFGYNAAPGVEGAADRLLNRIATGEVTPQEVSNWLVGTSQVGAKGESSRLLHRITEATQGDPEALQAIRGGVWNRLSQGTEGATARAPEKIASDINQFLNGTGRALAQELYTPEQQGVMRSYADTLRRGQVAREQTAEVARSTRPGTTTVERGPLQQLADRVVGRGQKSDEALFRTIHGYAQKGGDVKALAGLVRELPQGMRGDIAASFIRGLGVNQAGDFTLDQFARQWKNITPQAKAVLFGNAGEKVTALNDIATIAARMRDVRSRYGNPSGTAQNSALTTIFSTLTGLVGGTAGVLPAVGMVGTGLAGYAGAKILATPATASSLAKYAKAVERVVEAPTTQNRALVSMTERNLINTVKTLGASRALPPASMSGMRQLQGTVPAGAENEQRRAPGVR